MLLSGSSYGDVEDQYHQQAPINPVAATGGPARLTSRHRVSFDAAIQLGSRKSDVLGDAHDLYAVSIMYFFFAYCLLHYHTW